MNRHPDPVRHFRPIAFRINSAVLVNCSMGFLFASLGGYAALLIVLKIAAPSYANYAHGLLTLVPFSFVYGYYQSTVKNRFFHPREIMEIVDHIYKNDGSVSSFYENPALMNQPDFFEIIQKDIACHIPRIDLVHYAKQGFPMLIFLGIALLVPPRMPPPSLQSQEILSSLTQPLIEMIVENEDILPEEEKEALLERIEDIRKSGQTVSKEQWEAIEEMEQRMDDAVQRSQQAVQSLAATVNDLQGIMNAAASPSSAGNIDQKQAELISDLHNALQNKNAPLSSALKKEISDAMGKLPGEMNIKELQDGLDKLSKCLGTLACCNGPGKNNGDGDGNGNPGRGGINRGRGDAAMVFGDEKKISGTYDQQELMNSYFQPDDLVDLGITPIEPNLDPGPFSPGTIRNFEKQDGSQVSRSRISPSQKNVVENYFSQ
jgi:polyhydroxyalkanoate synthesis regulator phasin